MSSGLVESYEVKEIKYEKVKLRLRVKGVVRTIIPHGLFSLNTLQSVQEERKSDRAVNGDGYPKLSGPLYDS